MTLQFNCPPVYFQGALHAASDLADQARSIHRGLMSLDLKPGDAVGVVLNNSPVAIATLFAMKATDYICVPVAPAMTEALIGGAFKNADTVAIICENADTNYPGLGGEVLVLTPDTLANTAGTPRPVTERRPDDTAFILLTSGSTGIPKGAMIPRRAVDSWAEIFADELFGLTPDDSLLFAAPLGNPIALTMAAGAARAQATLAIPAQQSPQELAATLEGGKVTVAMGVPWIAHRMLQLNKMMPAAFDTLRLMVLGGAIVEADLADRIRKEIGCTVGVIYALSEFIPAAALRDFSDLPTGCVGKPVGDTRIQIAPMGTTKDGKPLGEIQLQGCQASLGYCNQPEQSAAVFGGCWVNSGDVGYLDDDENLVVVDRVDDVFSVGGTKVYPSSPEAVLRQNPQVAEATVVGIDHDALGKVPVAWVAVAQGVEPDAVALIQWCKDRLPAPEVPRAIRFIDQIPRNPAGKVLKFQLASKSD